MKSPAFQFYAQDFLTGVMYLTNEEIGIYIKMLSKQWTDGKIPKKRLRLLVGLDWENFSEELKEKFEDKGEHVINRRLEQERDKKEAFIEKQRKNGSKGGRPKKNKPKENPNESQKKPLEDRRLKTEEEDEKEIEDEKIKEIVEIFNSKCSNLPKVIKITDKRKSAIKARAKEHGLQKIGTVFELTSQSNFLNGKNKEGWQASFDWIMNTNNFIKILEKNYQNEKSSNNSPKIGRQTLDDIKSNLQGWKPE